MKLADYLKELGSVNRLAEASGLHPVLISQWKTGTRKVPAKHCPAVERATGGVVRCEDLRPDVDWAYLRATNCDAPTVGAGDTAPEPHQEAA